MINGQKVSLRPREVADAANEYAWRRDGELAALDAVVPIDMTFEEYLEYYIDEIRYSPNSEHYFAIETTDSQHIGCCLWFDIDEVGKQAEIGIMIGDRDYWSQGYGTDAVVTLLNHVFTVTELDRMYLKTLNWNIRAQKCFSKCGFVRYGDLINGEHSFILMEIYRQQWLNSKAPYTAIEGHNDTRIAGEVFGVDG